MDATLDTNFFFYFVSSVEHSCCLIKGSKVKDKVKVKGKEKKEKKRREGGKRRKKRRKRRTVISFYYRNVRSRDLDFKKNSLRGTTWG